MEEAVIKRIMPHSVEAEQSVIGSMLMDREAVLVASELLTGEDFYQRQYGLVFEAMVALFGRDEPVDLVTLQNELRAMDAPEEVSGMEFVREILNRVPTSANVKYYANIVAEKSTLRRMEFVREILNRVPTSANVKYYANIVAEKSTLRRLIHLNDEINNLCYAGTEPLETVLEQTEKKVFDLVQRRNAGDFVPIKQVVLNTIQKIELIHLNDEINNLCYAGTEPLETVLEQTEKKVFDLVQRRNAGDFVPIKQVVLNTIQKIEAASRTKGNVTGIATGFKDLDYQTSGFQPSDLILIAARPSMGKTAFVLNIAQYMAFRSNETVAIFSLEMSKEQLVNRLLSMESGVDAQKLRNGNLTDADWERLVEGAEGVARSNLIIDDTPGITLAELRSKCRKYKLENKLGIIMIDYLQLMSGGGRARSNLIIDDTPGITLAELRSKCRKYKLENKLGIIMIDYLQLMSGGGRSSDSRQQEISDISRGLKSLARELNVPVVALSQLSRAVEQRPDHRPMLSDLRESGAIEQDADMVMFLYRDSYYNKDTEMKNLAEVIVAKQRNGPVGTINLLWMPEYTTFKNFKPGPPV